LKIDSQGNVFTTGPGGILVVSPEGKHLGTFATGQGTANVAFGEDGSRLSFRQSGSFALPARVAARVQSSAVLP
jgi:gluconolactonase